MIIDNSCLGLANTQYERFTPFLVIKIKGMTVDIWMIRDYNPPRCFQKKISGRSKHNVGLTLWMKNNICMTYLRTRHYNPYQGGIICASTNH
jgi:hypothetical protein